MLTAGPSSPLGGRSIPEFRSLQNARRALSRNGDAARCLFPRGARHSWSLVLLGMRKVHVKPKMIGSVIVGASGPLESAWPHPRHRAGQCQLSTSLFTTASTTTLETLVSRTQREEREFGRSKAHPALCRKSSRNCESACSYWQGR